MLLMFNSAVSEVLFASHVVYESWEGAALYKPERYPAKGLVRNAQLFRRRRWCPCASKYGGNRGFVGAREEDRRERLNFSFVLSTASHLLETLAGSRGPPPVRLFLDVSNNNALSIADPKFLARMLP